MIDENPFSNEENAANNILELVEYLKKTDDSSSIYRGQTKKYSGPLLPSAFRGILKDIPLIQENDPLIKKSIIGIGKRFIGNYTWDLEDYHENIDRIIMDLNKCKPPDSARDSKSYLDTKFQLVENKWPKNKIISPTDILLTAIFQTNEYNTHLKHHDYLYANQMMLRKYFPSSNIDFVKKEKIINEYIEGRLRYRIFTDIILSSLSYVMGSLISQQYGFQSGLLDATSSIEIASFFATHESPSYQLIKTTDGNAKYGIIYKIPKAAHINSKSDAIANAYGKHGTLDIYELLNEFEDNISFSESIQSIKKCFEKRCEPEEFRRNYHKIKFPKGSISSSRIGHQQACVIIPDQIEIKLDEVIHRNNINSLSTSDSDFRIQMSIEDLHFRPGLKCYYFKHTTLNPCPKITPSYLWPNTNDYFIRLLVSMFLDGFSYYLPGQAFVMPNRLDLISPGYGEINFSSVCKEIDSLNKSKTKLLGSLFMRSKYDLDATNIVYKAASYIYRGIISGEKEIIMMGLKLCKKEWNKTPMNSTLVALILISLNALNRKSEFDKMIAKCENKISKRYGAYFAHHTCSTMFNTLHSLALSPTFALEAYRFYRKEKEFMSLF